MASSAGQRVTNPPKRFIDQIRQEDQGKIASTMSSSESNDVTLADLMAMMKKSHESQEDFRKSQDKRFDRLENQFKDINSHLSQHDTQIAKVEKNLAVLHKNQLEYQAISKCHTENISSVSTDVEALKEAVKLLQCQASSGSTSFNPVLSSTYVPPIQSTSTMHERPSNVNFIPSLVDSGRPSYLSPMERMSDVVSEFSGGFDDVHPEKFLNELSNYFENSYLTDIQKLSAVQRRLKNNAYMWYESLIPSPTVYTEFVQCFRQQFWSADIQHRVYDDIFRPYQHRLSTGLVTYAIRWITKAKYLNPPVQQLSLVSTIIQHYPSALATALRGRGPKTTSELVSVLTEFENTASFWEQPRSGQQQNNERQNDNLNDQRYGNRFSNNQYRGNWTSQPNRGRFNNNNRRYETRNDRRPIQNSSEQPRVQQMEISENENGSTQ